MMCATLVGFSPRSRPTSTATESHACPTILGWRTTSSLCLQLGVLRPDGREHDWLYQGLSTQAVVYTAHLG